MKLAFRLAWRELRGGVRGLRIVLACLALGVAAIAAVGTLREGVLRGLAADGSRILGGDIDISAGAQPLPAELADYLRAQGARLSDVVTLRSMLVADSGARMLVEVKAADSSWPLIGTATMDPPGPIPQALASGGLLADPLVLSRLGVKIGDTLRLGEAPLVLRGTLTGEPDRIASPSIFGPRALIALDTLPRTALLQPGAIVQHHLRAVLAPGTDIAALGQGIRTRFGDQGWRIRDGRNAAPTVVQFIDRTGLFLTLVGLTTLLVGGIGVANGVRAWLESRARSIAILRCLGASSRLVFAVALIQVMALAGLGIGIGIVLGAGLPVLAGGMLRDVLPVPPVLGVFMRPLLLAAVYGLLTASGFALWPLARAMQIPGGALFRDALLPDPMRPPWPIIAATAMLAAALVALTVATSDDRMFALWFCAAAAATLLVFWLSGVAVERFAARLPHRGAVWAKLGLSSLHRPGSSTRLLLMSLGLGLTTLAAVALIEGNLRAQVQGQMPDQAPSFFFIDIQNDQLSRFRAIIAAVPGASDLQTVPSLRARIVAVNGVPAAQMRTTPDAAWALRGDRGLTYAGAMPAGTQLISGHWWPADYSGPPLLSLDAALARGWGVKLDDVVRVNVLGREIDLRVTSLRTVAWRSLGLNFTMITTPAPLDHAPHTHIATVRAPLAEQAGLLRAVTDALPNVSGIRVGDVLDAVALLLGQIGTALTAAGSVTLAAGALVLTSAVAAGQRRRVHEAVILKTLGATRAQIRAAWLLEFGLLGAVAGGLAAGIGTACSYAVLHFVMAAGWSFLPGTLALTILGCVALMLVFGYAGTEKALRARAAPYLRNE